MPAEAPTAGNGEQPFPFSDAASCKAWLEQLWHSSVAECHAALSSGVQQIPQAALQPAVKFESLELMRETVALVQFEHARRCRGKPAPLDAEERVVWEGTVGVWQAMASAYESLIADMAGAAPELAGEAPLVCQRALRYTGLAMAEHSRAYHAVTGALWRQLHRLYVFAESAGIATTEVQDAVGRFEPVTSCAATYVHALLAHLAQPDALTLQQMGYVDHWLDQWEKLVGLSPQPPPESAIPALAVDLTSSKGIGFAEDVSASDVRHLRLEELARTLRHAAVALKQGQTPAELGLGELPGDACEKLLLLLNIQWCAAGTGRVDERTPAEIKVMIFPTIRSIHYHLTGRPFRQPGGAGQGEPVTLTQRSEAMETWLVVNRSVSGFLGLCRDPRTVTRVGHSQLFGLQARATKNMYLGIVQRLVVDEDGGIWAGMRLIPGAPQTAAARIADIATSDPEPAKYDRALLMPEDPSRKVPTSIVLQPGWYQANRILDLHTGPAQKIRLRMLLDAGPNFERAGYAVIGS